MSNRNAILSLAVSVRGRVLCGGDDDAAPRPRYQPKEFHMLTGYSQKRNRHMILLFSLGGNIIRDPRPAVPQLVVLT